MDEICWPLRSNLLPLALGVESQNKTMRFVVADGGSSHGVVELQVHPDMWQTKVESGGLRPETDALGLRFSLNTSSAARARDGHVVAFFQRSLETRFLFLASYA
jgi:hypothetical protein